MNSINASSLFHFTDCLDTLELILQNGFRYSYCYEEYDKEIIFNHNNPDYANFFVGSNNIKRGVAMPMICFCDIPLLRANKHADVYGRYIIGIEKKYANALYNSLNPVLYLNSDRIRLALRDISISENNFNNDKAYYYKESVNYIIAYSKRYRGNDIFRDNKEFCFYDEREWRTVLEDGKCNIPWIWNVEFKSKDEFKKFIQPYNNELYSSSCAYLRFTDFKDVVDEDHFCNFITHIVVGNDDEISQLIDFIFDKEIQLFGNNKLSDKARKILVSKITSFERIEKDF